MPSTEMSTSDGTPAFEVNGKLLTRLRPADDSLVLLGVPPEERQMLIKADPYVFHVTPHYDGYPAVLARLASLHSERLKHFLLRRLREVAPSVWLPSSITMPPLRSPPISLKKSV